MMQASNCEEGKKLKVSSSFGGYEINIFQRGSNQKSLCSEHIMKTSIIINGFDILRQELLFCFFR